MVHKMHSISRPNCAAKVAFLHICKPCQNLSSCIWLKGGISTCMYRCAADLYCVLETCGTSAHIHNFELRMRLIVTLSPGMTDMDISVGAGTMPFYLGQETNKEIQLWEGQ